MRETYTIIKEKYDTNTGETIVTINTDFGSFTGVTKIDDIDINYPSLFQGFEIALGKAQRKWAKTMAIIYREKVRTLKAISKQFSNHSNPQPGSHEAILVWKELEKAEKEYSLWKKRIKVMDKAITDRISARDKLVKNYIIGDKKD